MKSNSLFGFFLLALFIAFYGCSESEEKCDLGSVKSQFSYEVELKIIDDPVDIVEGDNAGGDKIIRLREFVNKASGGGCIIYFKSGGDSWKGLWGREGYLHTDKGEVVDVFITKSS